MKCYIYNLRQDSFFSGFVSLSGGYRDMYTSTWQNNLNEVIHTPQELIYSVICSIYVHTPVSLNDLIVVDDGFDFTNPLWLPVDGVDGLEKVNGIYK